MKIIFTDNQLPDINGIQIISIFNKFAENRLQKPRIFMVSGETGANFREQIEQLGVDGFLQKPLDFELLKNTI